MVLEETFQKRAILIGVCEYDGTSWQNLAGPKKDVEKWAGQLSSLGFEIDTLTSRQETTRTSILSRVRDICFQMPSRGSLLIVFSGHGTRVSRQQWLVPSDAPSLPSGRNAMSLLANYEDYLLPADFRGAISETDAEHTMVVIDACRTPLPHAEHRGSPFSAAPSRPNQRVIMVHAALPGGAANESMAGGLLSSALVGALAELGGDVTLSDIFADADRRLRENLAQHDMLTPDSGLRVQWEWGPNFDVHATKFFGAPPLPLRTASPAPAKKKNPPALPGTPHLDLEAFRSAPGRERRELAYAFLRQWYRIGRDAVVTAKSAPARNIPTDHDSRVYIDDDGFMDFNFWSSTSPVNKLSDTNSCFWFYLSLQTVEFRLKQVPSPENVEIHLGAVLWPFGMRTGARWRSMDQIAAALRQSRNPLDAKENEYGNLQIELARFTLADLSREKLADALGNALRCTEKRVLQVASRK